MCGSVCERMLNLTLVLNNQSTAGAFSGLDSLCVLEFDLNALAGAQVLLLLSFMQFLKNQLDGSHDYVGMS